MLQKTFPTLQNPLLIKQDRGMQITDLVNSGSKHALFGGIPEEKRQEYDFSSLRNKPFSLSQSNWWNRSRKRFYKASTLHGRELSC